MASYFGEQNRISMRPNFHTALVEGIDGNPLASGSISQESEPLQLNINQHQEMLAIDIIQSPSYPLLLELPWETLEQEYGEHFMKAVEKLFWEFLDRLQKALPAMPTDQIPSEDPGRFLIPAEEPPFLQIKPSLPSKAVQLREWASEANPSSPSSHSKQSRKSQRGTSAVEQQMAAHAEAGCVGEIGSLGGQKPFPIAAAGEEQQRHSLLEEEERSREMTVASHIRRVDTAVLVRNQKIEKLQHSQRRFSPSDDLMEKNIRCVQQRKDNDEKQHQSPAASLVSEDSPLEKRQGPGEQNLKEDSWKHNEHDMAPVEHQEMSTEESVTPELLLPLMEGRRGLVFTEVPFPQEVGSLNFLWSNNGTTKSMEGVLVSSELLTAHTLANAEQLIPLEEGTSDHLKAGTTGPDEELSEDRQDMPERVRAGSAAGTSEFLLPQIVVASDHLFEGAVTSPKMVGSGKANTLVVQGGDWLYATDTLSPSDVGVIEVHALCESNDPKELPLSFGYTPGGLHKAGVTEVMELGRGGISDGLDMSHTGFYEIQDSVLVGSYDDVGPCETRNQEVLDLERTTLLEAHGFDETATNKKLCSGRVGPHKVLGSCEERTPDDVEYCLLLSEHGGSGNLTNDSLEGDYSGYVAGRTNERLRELTGKIMARTAGSKTKNGSVFGILDLDSSLEEMENDEDFSPPNPFQSQEMSQGLHDICQSASHSIGEGQGGLSGTVQSTGGKYFMAATLQNIEQTPLLAGKPFHVMTLQEGSRAAQSIDTEIALVGGSRVPLEKRSGRMSGMIKTNILSHYPELTGRAKSEGQGGCSASELSAIIDNQRIRRATDVIMNCEEQAGSSAKVSNVNNKGHGCHRAPVLSVSSEKWGGIRALLPSVSSEEHGVSTASVPSVNNGEQIGRTVSEESVNSLSEWITCNLCHGVGRLRRASLDPFHHQIAESSPHVNITTGQPQQPHPIRRTRKDLEVGAEGSHSEQHRPSMHTDLISTTACNQFSHITVCAPASILLHCPQFQPVVQLAQYYRQDLIILPSVACLADSITPAGPFGCQNTAVSVEGTILCDHAPNMATPGLTSRVVSEDFCLHFEVDSMDVSNSDPESHPFNSQLVFDNKLSQGQTLSQCHLSSASKRVRRDPKSTASLLLGPFTGHPDTMHDSLLGSTRRGTVTEDLSRLTVCAPANLFLHCPRFQPFVPIARLSNQDLTKLHWVSALGDSSSRTCFHTATEDSCQNTETLQETTVRSSKATNISTLGESYSTSSEDISLSLESGSTDRNSSDLDYCPFSGRAINFYRDIAQISKSDRPRRFHK
ncbi:uncharacterized protein [Ambystoma mexicanum]|uniref:uncharacterized protein n=1 Tax=Ambystoma mexicanum TaxID=8296 RepID=UPI0037E966CC